MEKMEKEKKSMHRKRTGQDFESVSINIASPEDILEWSHGEVTGAETINYRTHRAERGGLFDEKIFGPERDYHCFCGKYNGLQYKGITCDKCGVEITRAAVRRDRMGHIELASPVAHIWFLRKIPSKVALLLDMSATNVRKVVYFSAYLVTSVNETKKREARKAIENEYETKTLNIHSVKTKKMYKEEYTKRVKELDSIFERNVISENEFHRLNQNFGGLFEASIGSEVVIDLLKNLNLKKLEKDLLKEIEVGTEVKNERLYKQLSLVRSFIRTKRKPEWMFLTRLPVTPPGTRPMVALDGGRYASSDLNDLYRRVIYRNLRLKRLQDISAPEVILRNEKRLLQEAVDSLLDCPTTPTTRSGAARQTKQLKSIAEYLKSKQGYFRANLLGKRADYTGRSVIVVGPDLKLDECGIPKIMALEIFRPFVISEILKREIAFNISFAGKLIDEQADIIWEILDKVIENKYVLLNRQPTLHRQSIQAFKPVLVEGKSITINPLVCTAFNADFDGDTMSVHLPLSEQAQTEAREIMVSTRNMIAPGSRSITTMPSKDISLGFYFATTLERDNGEEKRVYLSVNEALSAYDYGIIKLRTRIIVRPSDKDRYKHFEGKPFETSVGRILFNNLLVDDQPFVNENVTKDVAKIAINSIAERHGIEVVVECLDKIKDFGFKQVTNSGITFSFSNLPTPVTREDICKEGQKKAAKISDFYNEGLISAPERMRQKVELWQSVKAELALEVKDILDDNNDLHYIIDSGSRGDLDNVNILVGMFGMVQSSQGIPIEEPIISSMKKGLTSIEMFSASFGGRKGLVDTALKTATGGYLYRQLFDVSQEVTITSNVCKSRKGFTVYKASASGLSISLAKKITGRFVSEDVVDKKKNIILPKNEKITLEKAREIEKNDSITQVVLRSPITCAVIGGVCQKCYGNDPTNDELVDIGEPIGTIAAQSIGEPGTQLTMRTRHTGGATGASADITTGLPRIMQLFGKRKPKSPAIISPIPGTVTEVNNSATEKKIVVTNPDSVKSKTVEIIVPHNRHIIVHKGQDVEKGAFLTDGDADLDELFDLTGKENVQQYLLREITKIYEIQGTELLSVHFEILINQLFSRCIVTESGDSTYTPGNILEKVEFKKTNIELEENGKQPLKAKEVIFGIINVSTTRSNFLSAASFQNTNNVLINAALNGSVDTLSGLKENVIIGRLVPTGSGFVGSKKQKMIQKVIDKQIADAEES